MKWARRCGLDFRRSFDVVAEINKRQKRLEATLLEVSKISTEDVDPGKAIIKIQAAIERGLAEADTAQPNTKEHISVSACTVLSFGMNTPAGITAVEILRRDATSLRAGIHALCERLSIFPCEPSELSIRKVAWFSHYGFRSSSAPTLPAFAAPLEDATIADVLHSVFAVHADIRRLLSPATSPQPHAGNTLVRLGAHEDEDDDEGAGPMIVDIDGEI
ncbi:hypothetical protein N0V85_004191 [Neurospora sp. IMI 360204]|nr:hypothetical protein N0V85_004191 [Neurospora sp. IMI 360204]